MNEARARLLVNFRQSVDHLMCLFGRSPPPPPFAPALNFAVLTPSGGQNMPMTYGSVREMIEDFSIVFGVPKYRTSKPKKVTRKFSFTRLLDPIDNLVTCPTCSNIHPSETICGKCYEKVHELTNTIKKEMMNYNPYVGEKQDSEIYVKFKGDPETKPEVVKGKRVVELQRERPTWFKNLIFKN